MEGFQEDYDLIKRRNYQIIKSNKLVQKTRYESITLFAFFVELKEKRQSRWLFQSQICRVWAS